MSGKIHSSCVGQRYIFLIMILPEISGQNGLTVQYRCGQCNELPTVLYFLRDICLLMRAKKFDF